jgi:hypothetical protein
MKFVITDRIIDEFFTFSFRRQPHEIRKKRLPVQVALAIRGLFISGFTYSRSKKVFQKLGIRGLSLAYLRFLIVFDTKSSFKEAFWDHTVLPRYSRFQNSRCFDWTYLPRITKETCICLVTDLFRKVHTSISLRTVQNEMQLRK